MIRHVMPRKSCKVQTYWTSEKYYEEGRKSPESEGPFFIIRKSLPFASEDIKQSEILGDFEETIILMPIQSRDKNASKKCFAYVISNYSYMKGKESKAIERYFDDEIKVQRLLNILGTLKEQASLIQERELMVGEEEDNPFQMAAEGIESGAESSREEKVGRW